jgi:predicted nucleotidyltransferase
MISEMDKKTIIDIAQKFKVSRIFLFGSSLDDTGKAYDID